MNKYVFYLFILVVNTAIADRYDPNGLVKNTIENNLEYKKQKTCNDSEDTKQILAKSCVKQICGPAKDIKSVYLNGDEFKKMDFSSAETSFQVDKSFLEGALKNNLDEREQLLGNLANRLLGKGIKLSDSEKSNFIFSLLRPNLNVVYNQDNGKILINHDHFDDLAKENKKILKLATDWIIKNMKKDLSLRKEFNLPLSHEEYVIFMGRELKQVGSIIKNVPGFSSDVLSQFKDYKDGFTSFAGNPNFIPAFYRDSIDSLGLLKNRILLEANIDLTKPKNFCQKGACDKFFRDFISKKLAGNIKTNRENIKRLRNEKPIESCRSIYYLDAYNKKSMYGEGRKKTMAHILSGIDKYLAYVKEAFSEETMMNLKGKIRGGTTWKIKGELPPTARQNITAKKVLFGRSEYYFNIDKFENNFPALSDFQILNLSLFPNDFLTSVTQVCVGTEGQLNRADDNYNELFKVLNISSFTCEHPVVGKKIIAHELGHILSALIAEDSGSDISRIKYLKRRECVSKKLLVPNYNHIIDKKFANDHMWTEEDMADHLGDRTYKQENLLGKPDQFVQCSYLPIKSGEFDQISLEYQALSPFSPTFYRLINAVNDRDTALPAVCTQILKNYDHIYKPNLCE